jgi:general secretion pathway protein D
MHVKVEISNVLNYITIAGIQEPEIGQQVDEANIRMKDGEVSILGGLNDKELQTIMSGVPGFTNIPGLSYLFGSKQKTVTDNQVLIAIIPHILRPQDLSTVADQGVFAGTERITRVERKASGTPVSTNPPSALPPATVPPRPGNPLVPPPSSRPQLPAGTKPPDQPGQESATQPAPAASQRAPGSSPPSGGPPPPAKP